MYSVYTAHLTFIHFSLNLGSLVFHFFHHLTYSVNNVYAGHSPAALRFGGPIPAHAMQKYTCTGCMKGIFADRCYSGNNSGKHIA